MRQFIYKLLFISALYVVFGIFTKNIYANTVNHISPLLAQRATITSPAGSTCPPYTTAPNYPGGGSPFNSINTIGSTTFRWNGAYTPNAKFTCL